MRPIYWALAKVATNAILTIVILRWSAPDALMCAIGFVCLYEIVEKRNAPRSGADGSGESGDAV